MLPPPPLPHRDPVEVGGSTVGEALAIAPDTYVVPGWWSSPGQATGLVLGTLVVRGRATAVVDTAPAALEDDWLAAVLALVDPTEVRWIVATGLDPVRTGCVTALHRLAPQATVIVPGRGCARLDLGPATVDVHEAVDALAGAGDPPPGFPVVAPGQMVVEVRHRQLLWTDIVGGPLPRPVIDVAALDDTTLLAALARRHRPLLAAEVERTAALAPRVLGSPFGPVARGRDVARVLELARRAEALR